MLRRVLGATALTGALALGAAPVVVPAPAQAGDDVNTLPVRPEWGTVAGRDGKLKKRACPTYTYDYSITPPEGIWAIETFIRGPGGRAVAGGAFLDGSDPLTGTGKFKLCGKTNRAGTYTILAKVSVDDGFGNITEGQLPPDTFTMKKRKRR